MGQFPTKLLEAARVIQAGGTPEKPSVRAFLEWFGAQRRGFYVVQQIRRTLEKLEIATDPDFESAYIDAPITFVSTRQHLVAAVPAVEVAEASPAYSVTIHDPTHRIGKLVSANKLPLAVKPDATLREAITKMLTYDYSQLPVMPGDRDVKGIISWRSIGSRLSLGKQCAHVRDCMEPHHEVDSNASLFSVIDSIIRNEYALVRSDDRRISGIVTTSDLSAQFLQLAEPFLLIGEIENHIRGLIDAKFTAQDLESTRDPNDKKRVISRASDLAFGEYLRLMESPDKWSRLGLPVDRAVFVAQLERLRTIRNDVMHFDPDGLAPSDLETLRKFAHFMQELQAIGLP